MASLATSTLTRVFRPHFHPDQRPPSQVRMEFSSQRGPVVFVVHMVGPCYPARVFTSEPNRRNQNEDQAAVSDETGGDGGKTGGAPSNAGEAGAGGEDGDGGGDDDPPIPPAAGDEPPRRQWLALLLRPFGRLWALIPDFVTALRRFDDVFPDDIHASIYHPGKTALLRELCRCRGAEWDLPQATRLWRGFWRRVRFGWLLYRCFRAWYKSVVSATADPSRG